VRLLVTNLRLSAQRQPSTITTAARFHTDCIRHSVHRPTVSEHGHELMPVKLVSDGINGNKNILRTTTTSTGLNHLRRRLQAATDPVTMHHFNRSLIQGNRSRFAVSAAGRRNKDGSNQYWRGRNTGTLSHDHRTTEVLQTDGRWHRPLLSNAHTRVLTSTASGFLRSRSFILPRDLTDKLTLTLSKLQ